MTVTVDIDKLADKVFEHMSTVANVDGISMQTHDTYMLAANHAREYVIALGLIMSQENIVQTALEEIIEQTLYED